MSMSSCEDDDFGLLKENSRQSEQHQQHPLPDSGSFTTHRFAGQAHQQPKGTTVPGVHPQQLRRLPLGGVPHNQQPSSSHSTHIGREERGVNGIAPSGSVEGQEQDNNRDEQDPAAVQEGVYVRPFLRPQPSQPRAAVAIAGQDAKNCFDDTTSSDPTFAASTQQVVSSPTSSPKHEDSDYHRQDPALAAATGDNYNHKQIDSNEKFQTRGCVGLAPAVEAVGSHSKRRDRDELDEDGASAHYVVTTSVSPSTPGSIKKPRPSSSSVSTAPPPLPAAVSSSSLAAAVGVGGDYRKDREEWSDSAIACLLDAYTDKYIQLNRGNLRGRDWEDVAVVVSQRSDQQQQNKYFKTVEQCKNKVDNLKKRYKAERQRITSGALSTSHWPWFKKLEVIVGTSSTPSTFTKSVSAEEDKPALSSPAAVAASIAVAPASSAISASGIKQGKRFSGAQPGPAQGILVTNPKMKAPSNPRWKRVVLRISGAVFSNNGPESVDPKVTMLIAREIAMASRLGVELAIVVGGRNFFCGESWVSAAAIDRTTAYQISMMATVMNSVLLQASLEKIGLQARVQTGLGMQEVAEPYIRRRAIRHLEKGRIVIFGGIGAGLAHPFLTTDTAAALRASEINADAILKGNNVDIGYDCTSSGKNGVTYEHVSFRDLASRGYIGMDMAAISFCEENRIPVLIFNLLEPGHLSRALCGEQVGILIDQLGAIS